MAPSSRTERSRCLLAVLVLWCAPAWSAPQIRHLDVSRDGARYRVEMDVHLAADAQRAYRVFSDPALLPQINPAVVVARPEPVPDAPGRLYTEVRLCVALICRTLHQVQDMAGRSAADGWHLTADVLPAQSDLRYGHAEWVFSDDDGATDLRLALEIEPDFWVPPLIGPWLVKDLLREQAERTCAGIEKLAAS